MKKTSRTESGFSILLILGGIAILGLITLLVLHQWNRSKTDQLQTNGAYQATNIINNLATFVADTNAWPHTLYYASNPTFSCLINNTSCAANASNAPAAGTYPLTAPGGNFILLDKGGSVFYTSTISSNGYNMAGIPCSTYDNVTGNDQCLFHAVLYWVATCGATVPCNSYTVYGYLLYKPKTASIFTHPFNPANYRFAISKSASGNIYFCCTIGCQHLTGDGGLAYATISVFSTANCFVGSSEVSNDFCDRAITSSPSGNNWAYSGYQSTAAGTCPQGPP